MSWMYDEWMQRPFAGSQLPGAPTNAEFIQRSIEKAEERKASKALKEPYQTDLSNLNFWESLWDKFSGNYSYRRQLEQFSKEAAFNAEEAQKQRAYEERLANTAYQRQVADLDVAGFNPALALGAGGAYVPSGAAASASGGRYQNNTHGFEFTMNAILAAVSLGIKAASSGASAALASEKAIDIARTRNDRRDYFANFAYRNFEQGNLYRRMGRR